MSTETRSIDYRYRIVIPDEMCDALGIDVGDTVELTLIDEYIVLKKWSDANDLSELL